MTTHDHLNDHSRTSSTLHDEREQKRGRRSTALIGELTPEAHEAARQSLKLSRRAYARKIGVSPATYIRKVNLNASLKTAPFSDVVGLAEQFLGLRDNYIVALKQELEHSKHVVEDASQRIAKIGLLLRLFEDGSEPVHPTLRLPTLTKGPAKIGVGRAAADILREAGRPMHALREILPALEARGYAVRARGGLVATLVRKRDIVRTSPGTFAWRPDDRVRQRRATVKPGISQAAVDILRESNKPLHALRELLPLLEARGFVLRSRSSISTLLSQQRFVQRTAPNTFTWVGERNEPSTGPSEMTPSEAPNTTPKSSTPDSTET